MLHEISTQADVFGLLHQEALAATRDEPLLAAMLDAHVVSQSRLEGCLTSVMASTLADRTLSVEALTCCFQGLYQAHPSLVESAACDMTAVLERDAASSDYLPIMLYLKGFQALQAHRLAHALWGDDRRILARALHHRATQVFGIDIHPACRVGRGVMLDHGTGIVIGETAEIGDNVSIMQGVTLGGTGKESGDRHPKVRSGVLIGAGATVLGNIEIGHGAQIGAGSVVLARVLEHTTVVGIPARQAGRPRCPSPSVTMEHGSFQHVASPQWYQQGS
ncbi:serine O-acetyltransferase [Kushneria sp. TE3]|uniref:serine O-acetyltransferase n=1 Tax=Kushneria sp. TE3 TaxID=3449832 RepID=UPI003F684A8E